jgi:hypothetical protein
MMVVMVVAILCCAGFIAYLAVIRDAIAITHAVFLVLLIIFAGFSFVLFLLSMETEGRLEINSHWGGLGGGLGGWRVSKSLTYLIVTASLVTLLATGMSRPVENPKLYLIERYRSTIQAAQNLGVKNLGFKVVGPRLILTGVASRLVANKVWDQIKLANPTYDDIQVNFAIENDSTAKD